MDWDLDRFLTTHLGMVSIVLPEPSPGADDGDRQGGHSGDGGRTGVTAHGQHAEGQKPGDRALRDSAVSTETFAGIHSDPGEIHLSMLICK